MWAEEVKLDDLLMAVKLKVMLKSMSDMEKGFKIHSNDQSVVVFPLKPEM